MRLKPHISVAAVTTALAMSMLASPAVADMLADQQITAPLLFDLIPVGDERVSTVNATGPVVDIVSPVTNKLIGDLLDQPAPPPPMASLQQIDAASAGLRCALTSSNSRVQALRPWEYRVTGDKSAGTFLFHIYWYKNARWVPENGQQVQVPRLEVCANSEVVAHPNSGGKNRLLYQGVGMALPNNNHDPRYLTKSHAVGDKLATVASTVNFNFGFSSTGPKVSASLNGSGSTGRHDGFAGDGIHYSHATDSFQKNTTGWWKANCSNVNFCGSNEPERVTMQTLWEFNSAATTNTVGLAVDGVMVTRSFAGG